MMGTCLGTPSNNAEKQIQNEDKSGVKNKNLDQAPARKFSTIESKRPKRSHSLKMKMSLSPYDNLLTNVLDSKPSEKDADWIVKKIQKRPDFSSLSKDALYNISLSFLKIQTKEKTSTVYLGSTKSTIFIVYDGELSVGTKIYKRGDVFGANSLATEQKKNVQEEGIKNDGKGKCFLWVLTRATYQKNLITFARQNDSKMNNLVKKIPAFAPLTELQQAKVASRLKNFKFAYGQKIISQGEKGNAIYFIETGNVNVVQHSRGSSGDQIVNKLSKGDFFGEASLYNNNKKTDNTRNADVIANSHCVSTYRLTREEFEDLLGPLHDIIRTNSATRVLNHIKAFAGLSVQEIETIASLLETRHYEKNDYIVRQGEKGDEMFIVGTGEIAFLRAEPTKKDSGLGESERKSNDLMFPSSGSIVTASDCGLEVKLPDRNAKKKKYKMNQQQSPKMKFIKNFNKININEKKEGSVSYGEMKDIGHLFANQYFGEGALLTKAPRRASAKVISENGASCYVLAGEKFRMLFGDKLIDNLANHFKKRSKAEEDKKGNLIELQDIEGIRLLGKGSYGKVTLVRHTVTGKTFALKQILKEKVEDLEQHDHINNEKTLLDSINHVMVCNLIRTFKNQQSLYMLMDSVMGGELFQLLQKNAKFTSEAVQFYAAQVALVFKYLHENDIVFRDLKPENIMIHSDGYIKVCDFGLAKRLRHGRSTYTLCGTPAYAAPEVYKVIGHNTACDWWTLGILIHELLIGYTPFKGRNANEVFNELQEYEAYYPRVQFPKGFTQIESVVLKSLLNPFPHNRLGSGVNGHTDVLNHKFFATMDFDKLLKKEIKAPHVPKINDCYDTSNFEKRKEGFERELKPAPEGYRHETWCARF